MKRLNALILVCVALAWPVHAGVQVTFVQPAAAGGGGGLSIGQVDCAQSGTITGGISTVSLSTTSGSTLILGAFYTTFGGGFEGIACDTDTTGFVQIGSTETVTGVGDSRLYYKENITGGTQTCTLDVVGDFATICAVEVLGAATSSALDSSATTYDSAEPYTTAGITTTVADTALIAFFARDGDSISDINGAESTGFTLQAEVPDCTALTCADIWTRIVSSSGSYNTSSTDDGTDEGSGVFLAAIAD